MAAAPGPPVPQTSASPALTLPTEPVGPLLPSLPRFSGHLACTGVREQASWSLPPTLAQTQGWNLPPAPHLLWPWVLIPTSPRPPPARVCGRQGGGSWSAVVSCSLCFRGTRGKCIYKLPSLWTSEPAGARESRQHPARPQHRERSGWARGPCWGAGAQRERLAHGRPGLSYPAHSGCLHALGCRRTGTRRCGPGRSPHAGTAGIGTRRFLSEESPGARRQERPQEKSSVAAVSRDDLKPN